MEALQVTSVDFIVSQTPREGLPDNHTGTCGYPPAPASLLSRPGTPSQYHAALQQPAYASPGCAKRPPGVIAANKVESQRHDN